MDFWFSVFLIKLSSPTIVLGSIIGGFAAARFTHVVIGAVIVAFLHELFIWSYENVPYFSVRSFLVSIPAAFIMVGVAFTIRRALERVLRAN